ncbi:MAG TPA: collagen-like protein [Metabacillus sp.]|nr:collagen-like protein [Metabacillus sp.]
MSRRNKIARMKLNGCCPTVSETECPPSCPSGPRGPQGEPGPAGPQGLQGPPGPAAPGPRTDCPCPVNFVQGIGGNFSLFCGSEPFKIFDSNVPTEMFMEIRQFESNINENLCELTVTVELDDGSTIVLTVPNPNTSTSTFEQSSAQFYSQMVRRITLQCQGGIGATRCRGFWNSQIFLRGSNTNLNCDCPVFVQNEEFGGNLPAQSGNYSLPCGGDEFTVFESGEPVEIIGQINLNDFQSNIDSCELEVTIELNNGSNLVFLIPNPNTSPTQSESNTIFYHTLDTRRITIQCLSGGPATGCRGSYINFLVLRAGTS